MAAQFSFDGTPRTTQHLRDVCWNAAGLILPLVAAFISVPLLMRHLGAAGFGAFSLLVAVFAYLAVLDLGFGSAVTYRVSAMLARGESDADIAHTVVTAAAASILIGLVVAAIAYFAAGYIPALLAGQPARLQQQAVAGLRLLAVATPMLFAGTLFSGVLSGYRRFGQVNGVRIVASALGALGPAVASSWWPDLVVACGLLVLVRIGVAVVHLLQCLRLPAAAARTTAWPPTSQEVSALLCFGGWLTVSNVLGPFMAYMDRFYLAAVRPVEEVAHYVAPYELATRVALIPAGVLPVVFPILVARWVHRETTEPRLLAQLAAAMALGCALPAAGLAVFGPEIMRAWTGLQLSADSATVLQLLAGAVFVNCVAQVFFMQLQAMGQTHLLARVHAAELVFYALLLWSVTSRWGVVGVALAWTVRVMVDSCVLCALSSLRLPPAVRHTCWQVLAMSITFGVALSASAWLPSPMWRAIAPVALILLLVGLRRRVPRSRKRKTSRSGATVDGRDDKDDARYAGKCHCETTRGRPGPLSHTTFRSISRGKNRAGTSAARWCRRRRKST